MYHPKVPNLCFLQKSILWHIHYRFAIDSSRGKLPFPKIIVSPQEPIKKIQTPFPKKLHFQALITAFLSFLINYWFLFVCGTGYEPLKKRYSQIDMHFALDIILDLLTHWEFAKNTMHTSDVEPHEGSDPGKTLVDVTYAMWCTSMTKTLTSWFVISFYLYLPIGENDPLFSFLWTLAWK